MGMSTSSPFHPVGIIVNRTEKPLWPRSSNAQPCPIVNQTLPGAVFARAANCAGPSFGRKVAVVRSLFVVLGHRPNSTPSS